MTARAVGALAAFACFFLHGCSSTKTNEALPTSDGGGATGGAGGSGGGAGGDAAPPCDDGGLMSDQDHCGACGHSCLGGECVEGKCQPAIIFANDPNSGATGTLGPLVLSDQRLFVGDTGDQGQVGSTGAIWAMDPDGKNVLRLDPPGSTEVAALALNAASVYWTSREGKLKQVTKAGGAVSELAAETAWLRALTATKNHLFYVAGAVIKQLYTVGSSSFEITPGLSTPGSLALSGGYLYFTTSGTGPSYTDGAVSRVPVDLAAPPIPSMKPIETLATGQPYAFALALDSTHAYWATSEGDIHRMKLDGSEQTKLATGAEDGDRTPQAIALDATHVYWTCWGACVNAGGCGSKQLFGRVQRVAKGGGAKEVLAEGTFLPTGVAVDASAVYWTNWWFTSVSRLAL